MLDAAQGGIPTGLLGRRELARKEKAGELPEKETLGRWLVDGRRGGNVTRLGRGGSDSAVSALNHHDGSTTLLCVPSTF